MSIELTPPCSPDFCLLMLEVSGGGVKPEPVFGTNGEQAMRYNLDGARKRVKAYDLVRERYPSHNFAKPNSIVRVYLK